MYHWQVSMVTLASVESWGWLCTWGTSWSFISCSDPCVRDKLAWMIRNFYYTPVFPLLVWICLQEMKEGCTTCSFISCTALVSCRASWISDILAWTSTVQPMKCLLRVQEREERGTFLFAFLSCTDSCFSKMRACKLTKVGKDLVIWANPHSLGILP